MCINVWVPEVQWDEYFLRCLLAMVILRVNVRENRRLLESKDENCLAGPDQGSFSSSIVSPRVAKEMLSEADRLQGMRQQPGPIVCHQ